MKNKQLAEDEIIYITEKLRDEALETLGKNNKVNLDVVIKWAGYHLNQIIMEYNFGKKRF